MDKPSLDFIKSVFSKYGDYDMTYLENSFLRYLTTKEIALQKTTKSKLTVLDIGAHWLFHALLYAIDGHQVIAADIYNMTEMDNLAIPGVANSYNIQLLPYRDMSNPVELNQLPDSSVDLVLFTEILEHITFNPIVFWKTIYRVLVTGGRIIVTTPNYRYLPHRFKEFMNVVAGYSSDPTVEHILGINTHGHHWKIYSSRDIKRYFRLLSPDLKVTRIEYFNTDHSGNLLKRTVRRLLTIFPYFRQTAFYEITLLDKKDGIIMQPRWELHGEGKSDKA